MSDTLELLRAAEELLVQNGGPTTTMEGEDSHVLVRMEDFKRLEQAVKWLKGEQ